MVSGLALAVGGVLLGPAAMASPSPTPAPTSATVDCVAKDPDTGKCVILGVVYALAEVGDTTYIGGDFTAVSGVPRSNVAAIDANGKLDASWNPSTDGVVYALAASADGSKIFLGGGFTTVNGEPRGRLAAVDPVNGQLVQGWGTTTSNNLVRALVTDANDRLYVGGSFGRIGGKAISRLAAVSQSTGQVDTAFNPQPAGTVRALTLSESGEKLYLGGPFTTVGGNARPGAAEVTAADGSVTSFAPTDGGVVIAMDMTPDGRLFFGTTSNRTWAYDPADGGVPEYRVRTGGDVQAILATNEEVYIGGHFNTIPESKLSRIALASFLPANGAVTGWNPGAPGPFGVWAMSLKQSPTATALSIGGDFSTVAGVRRRGYARFNF
jgi:hypothetical protein